MIAYVTPGSHDIQRAGTSRRAILRGLLSRSGRQQAQRVLHPLIRLEHSRSNHAAAPLSIVLLATSQLERIDAARCPR